MLTADEANELILEVACLNRRKLAAYRVKGVQGSDIPQDSLFEFAWLPRETIEKRHHAISKQVKHNSYSSKGNSRLQACWKVACKKEKGGHASKGSAKDNECIQLIKKTQRVFLAHNVLDHRHQSIPRAQWAPKWMMAKGRCPSRT